MRRVSCSRVALLVLLSARYALLCVCPGQYPTCNRQTGWCSGDTYTTHSSYLTGCTTPGTWCATYCGMVLGNDCTEDFVPLPHIPWERARILLSHWNDEAANLLERASYSIYPSIELLNEPNISTVERYRRHREVLHSWNLSECGNCRFVSPKIAPHPRVLHHEDLEALMLHDDRAEVTILAIRGTVEHDDNTYDTTNWDRNLDPRLTDMQHGVHLHHGYLNASELLLPGIVGYLAQHHTSASTLLLTGHSLGGAIATVISYLLRKRGHVVGPLGLVTFGAPRVGDSAFRADFAREVQAAWRVVRAEDLVPSVPLYALGFRHIGREIFFDQERQMRTCCSALTEDPSCAFGGFFRGSFQWDHVYQAQHSSQEYMATGGVTGRVGTLRCEGVDKFCCDDHCTLLGQDDGTVRMHVCSFSAAVAGERDRTLSPPITGGDAVIAAAEGAAVVPALNMVEIKVPGVGTRGGTCTCADGAAYQVGDNGDDCASLACVGGITGECGFPNPGGAGVRVTCHGARSGARGRGFDSILLLAIAGGVSGALFCALWFWRVPLRSRCARAPSRHIKRDKEADATLRSPPTRVSGIAEISGTESSVAIGVSLDTHRVPPPRRAPSVAARAVSWLRRRSSVQWTKEEALEGVYDQQKIGAFGRVCGAVFGLVVQAVPPTAEQRRVLLGGSHGFTPTSSRDGPAVAGKPAFGLCYVPWRHINLKMAAVNMTVRLAFTTWAAYLVLVKSTIPLGCKESICDLLGGCGTCEPGEHCLPTVSDAQIRALEDQGRCPPYFGISPPAAFPLLPDRLREAMAGYETMTTARTLISFFSEVAALGLVYAALAAWPTPRRSQALVRAAFGFALAPPFLLSLAFPMQSGVDSSLAVRKMCADVTRLLSQSSAVQGANRWILDLPLPPFADFCDLQPVEWGRYLERAMVEAGVRVYTHNVTLEQTCDVAEARRRECKSGACQECFGDVIESDLIFGGAPGFTAAMQEQEQQRQLLSDEPSPPPTPPRPPVPLTPPTLATRRRELFHELGHTPGNGPEWGPSWPPFPPAPPDGYSPFPPAPPATPPEPPFPPMVPFPPLSPLSPFMPCPPQTPCPPWSPAPPFYPDPPAPPMPQFGSDNPGGDAPEDPPSPVLPPVPPLSPVPPAGPPAPPAQPVLSPPPAMPPEPPAPPQSPCPPHPPLLPVSNNDDAEVRRLVRNPCIDFATMSQVCHGRDDKHATSLASACPEFTALSEGERAVAQVYNAVERIDPENPFDAGITPCNYSGRSGGFSDQFSICSVLATTVFGVAEQFRNCTRCHEPFATRLAATAAAAPAAAPPPPLPPGATANTTCIEYCLPVFTADMLGERVVPNFIASLCAGSDILARVTDVLNLAKEIEAFEIAVGVSAMLLSVTTLSPATLSVGMAMMYACMVLKVSLPWVRLPTFLVCLVAAVILPLVVGVLAGIFQVAADGWSLGISLMYLLSFAHVLPTSEFVRAKSFAEGAKETTRRGWISTICLTAVLVLLAFWIGTSTRLRTVLRQTRVLDLDNLHLIDTPSAPVLRLVQMLLDFYGKVILSRVFFTDILLYIIAHTELETPSQRQRIMHEEVHCLFALSEPPPPPGSARARCDGDMGTSEGGKGNEHSSAAPACADDVTPPPLSTPAPPPPAVEAEMDTPPPPPPPPPRVLGGRESGTRDDLAAPSPTSDIVTNESRDDAPLPAAVQSSE